MKKANTSFYELLTLLNVKNLPALFSVFFILCGLEAVSAFIYIAGLPADPKNSLLFGLSLQRILILGGVLLYFLISIFGSLLGIRNKTNPVFISTIKKISSKKVFFCSLFICSIALFVISIPESGLRGQYQAIFEKTDPIFLLIFLFNFQLVSLLSFLYIDALDPDERKIFLKNTLIRYFLPAAAFIFPFLFFFPRTIPINGEFYGVSNDFIPTSYSYKVYLLDNLSHFHFPLWSPSEAGGFPFFSNPFAQALYPLNIPQAILYFINGGYSILDHQRFAVLGISIFAVGLYFWLKEFSLSTRSVFFTSLLIPVSFRLAELIRYPSGLHSAAWYPWILYALTKLGTSVSTKKLVWNTFIFIFSCFSLVTGGYQYYLYYFIFLIIPYLLVIILPPTRRLFFIDSTPIKRRNFLSIVFAGILTVVITAPYLIRMMNLLSLTTSRGGGDYLFSTTQFFNFIDTLGSLVYPPSAQPEGFYYFSIPCLMIILLFAVTQPLLRTSEWATPDLGKTWNFWFLNPWVKILIIGWFITISYISYGKESYLFNFLWHFFPYFSHMRFIGRINIILIPVIALLLGISLDYFCQVFTNLKETSSKLKNGFLRWWFVICGIYFSLGSIQIFLIQTRAIDPLWKSYFYVFYNQQYLFVFSGIISFLFLSITGYILSKSKSTKNHSMVFVMITLFILSAVDLWHVGAYMYWNGTLKTSEDVRKVIHIPDKIFMDSFKYQRSGAFIPPEVKLTPVYFASYNDSWYYINYKYFYQDHDFESNSRNEVLGISDGRRIFFSKSISHETISDFLHDSKQQYFHYEIVKFNGDALKLRISVSEDGYISYIDNWDPDWKGYLNNKEVPVEKLFSTFKSIKVGKGDWDVLFSYEPPLFPDFNLFSLKND